MLSINKKCKINIVNFILQ